MGKTIYGGTVVAKTCEDMMLKKLNEELNNVVILEKRDSTVEEILEVIKLHSVAAYGAENKLFTTITYSCEMDDYSVKSMIDNMFLGY